MRRKRKVARYDGWIWMGDITETEQKRNFIVRAEYIDL